MTCVVGLVEDSKVYMGADSAGVEWSSIVSRKDPKVFTRGDFIFGFTDSFRMGQLLRYQLCIPEYFLWLDIDDYMHTLFIEAVRKCFLDYGYAKKEHSVESGGHFLVGFSGHLYCVDPDFQLGESQEKYYAIGCGRDVAYGNMYATERLQGSSAENRIVSALAAAEHFCTGVRRPFNVLHV
jgi:hypothetical protein